MSSSASGPGSSQPTNPGTCTLHSQPFPAPGTGRFWCWASPFRRPDDTTIGVRVPHPDGDNDPWGYLVFSSLRHEAGKESSLHRHFNFFPQNNDSAAQLQVQQAVGIWQEMAQQYLINSTFRSVDEMVGSIQTFVQRNAPRAYQDKVVLIWGDPTITNAVLRSNSYSHFALSFYKGMVNEAVQKLSASTHRTRTNLPGGKEEPRRKEPAPSASLGGFPTIHKLSSLVLQYIEDCTDTRPTMQLAKAELRAQVNTVRSLKMVPYPHRPAMKEDWNISAASHIGSTKNGRQALETEIARLMKDPSDLFLEDQQRKVIRRPFSMLHYDYGVRHIREIGSASQSANIFNSSYAITAEDCERLVNDPTAKAMAGAVNDEDADTVTIKQELDD